MKNEFAKHITHYLDILTSVFVVLNLDVSVFFYQWPRQDLYEFIGFLT